MTAQSETKPVACPVCGSSDTYHRGGDRLLSHWCNMCDSIWNESKRHPTVTEAEAQEAFEALHGKIPDSSWWDRILWTRQQEVWLAALRWIEGVEK